MRITRTRATVRTILIILENARRATAVRTVLYGLIYSSPTRFPTLTTDTIIGLLMFHSSFCFFFYFISRFSSPFDCTTRDGNISLYDDDNNNNNNNNNNNK
jgi:hypothetical protein